MDISPFNQNIDHLFSSTVYHIDFYQRDYKWNEEPVTRLLNDIFFKFDEKYLSHADVDASKEAVSAHYPWYYLNTYVTNTIDGRVYIVDGQQRLTTLFMLILGEIPPFYLEKDIGYDPRKLYYNIDNADFQYYQVTKMKGSKLWWRVVDCFSDVVINEYEIAEQIATDSSERFQLAKKYGDNLTSLRQITQTDLPSQLVPYQATITEAIDIFDRVNSQGTKLSDADLALTHITGKWPQARREFKEKIDDVRAKHFYFNLAFMTWALKSVITKRDRYEQIQ